jgi:hypothetical protein
MRLAVRLSRSRYDRGGKLGQGALTTVLDPSVPSLPPARVESPRGVLRASTARTGLVPMPPRCRMTKEGVGRDSHSQLGRIGQQGGAGLDPSVPSLPPARVESPRGVLRASTARTGATPSQECRMTKEGVGRDSHSQLGRIGQQGGAGHAAGPRPVARIAKGGWAR